MKQKWWVGAVLMLLAVLGTADVVAGGRAELVKQIESSILLTGIIEVDLLGDVKDYKLNSTDKLSPNIQKFLDTNIRAWKFDITALPNGLVGPNTILRNQMSLRLVAKAQEDKNYEVRIAGANFSPLTVEEGSDIRVDGKMKSPAYPGSAAIAGVSATAYMLLKIGADGKVQDAVAEQVNLRTLANNEREMQRWRDVFTRNAITVAKRWRFIVPDHTGESDTPYVVVRVPVMYMLNGMSGDEDSWISYIPGPRINNPWSDDEDQKPGFSPDALAANGIYMENKNSLRLLTPLQKQG